MERSAAPVPAALSWPAMPSRLCRTAVLAIALVVASSVVAERAAAESFEFVTFTPPQGWTHQSGASGKSYRRKAAGGTGIITLLASRPATGSPEQEFAALWRTTVHPDLRNQPPEPQVQRDGDYTVALGARQMTTKGELVTVTLVVVLGRGRALPMVSMAGGDTALREVLAFFDTMNTVPSEPAPRAPGTPPPGRAPAPAVPAPATPAPAAPAPAAPAPASPAPAAATTPPAAQPPAHTSPDGIDVDFDVPRGYASRREGRAIVLAPTTVDNKTPCAYGLLPSRRSSGALDKDAQAALAEVLPGWQRTNDRYNAMRGTSAAGWSFYWFRADLQHLVNGSYEYAAAMTMAFPGDKGRVNIVWGAGNPARCTLDDVSFARLFHGLRPRGWTSDGGNALARDLAGTWRFTASVGVMQYKFLAGGRYEFGLGSITQLGHLETTSSNVHDGKFELRGSELILTPDNRARPIVKRRVRVYDEYVLGRWTRAMSLLDDAGSPPAEVQYMRIDDAK
jgi:hypothetical protein